MLNILQLNRFKPFLFSQSHDVSLKSSLGVLNIGLTMLTVLFILSGCQPFQRLLEKKQIEPSSAQLSKSSSKSSTELKITSASYQIELSEQVNSLFIRAELNLEPIEAKASEQYVLTLQRPISALTFQKKHIPCTEEWVESEQQVRYYCPKSVFQGKSKLKLEFSYSVSFSQMVGYSQIVEGERSYHLVYLPKKLVGEVLIGFGSPVPFPRDVSLQAHKKLKLFGHPLSTETTFSSVLFTPKEHEQKAQLSKEIPSQQQTQDAFTQLSWSNTESDEAYALFFGFGSWESAHSFDLKFKLNRSGEATEQISQKATLVSPLGSQHHQVGKESLKSLQLKLIQDHSQALEAIWHTKKTVDLEQELNNEFPLLFIILPEHPEYIPPSLRSSGIIFIDESWIYRYLHFAYALPQWESLKLFRDLYFSLHMRFNSQINQKFLRMLGAWRSLTHLAQTNLLPEESQLNQADAYQKGREYYLIGQTRKLYRFAEDYLGSQTKQKRIQDQVFTSVINMMNSWLVLKGDLVSKQVQLDLHKGFKQSLKVQEKLNLHKQVIRLGQQLNQLDSHFKQVIESYMTHSGLPLLYVKWNQEKRGDRYHIRFTLSQRPFTPGRAVEQLKPNMWVLPICLKLGIRDQPPRAHCVLLDQPEASHFELSLEAPLDWVHPNMDQTGLYLWSLDQEDFKKLLNAELKQLTLAEFLSLSEMSGALLDSPQGSPINYLQSVRELAKAQDHPLSLDALFHHLNQVVHYFGSQDDQVGDVEQWASSILMGVMLSKNPTYPLNFLTQLQLAQWDRSELSIEQEFMKAEPTKRKREEEMIKKFIRPTSSQEAIEDDVAQVKLEQIQYPLLLKALSGDQKLWQALFNKLAQSEDQPLVRLLVIQTLVQFLNPSLFAKTLDLLTYTEQEHEKAEEMLSNKDLNQDEAIKDEDERSEAEDHEHDEEDNEVESIDKEKIVSLQLRLEDALELILSIRSPRAKRIAWQWLISSKVPLTQKVSLASRSDIQTALLTWSNAICDDSGLKQLEFIFKGELGFLQSSLEASVQQLQEVKRCVRVRSLKPNVEAWIKGSY